MGCCNVAFSSYMTEASANSQSTSITIGATIKFDKTEANFGGGYSTSTGKFTAPSSGVYGFTWTFCVDSRSTDGSPWHYGEYGTQLMSGSSVIGVLHADTETKGDDACSTGFVIKYVSEDTEVYVKNIYDNTELSRQVAFMAYDINGNNFGKGRTVIYDKIVTNKGNVYNRYAGKFTSPSDGTYALT
ncbi:C1QL [Mytilus coruscus]|uniref:C1QL n=1 Tax=Mytilus coruscus TaxID=42192 RepID=A0A6J8BKL1_MYTCO|nr:C1QL [Mytilus coruscus]